LIAYVKPLFYKKQRIISFFYQTIKSLDSLLL